MTIQSFTADALQSHWNVAEELRSFSERFSSRWTAWRRYRNVRAELLHYSPQQLAELGIGNSDIEFIAVDAARS